MSGATESDQPVVLATDREEEAYREGRIDEHHRTDVASGNLGNVEDAAYREGRGDERIRTERMSSAAAKDGYARGRRDERAQRRGSPLLTILLLIVVAVGAVLIYFAIQQGSFSNGGAVVDQKLSKAADTVKAPIRGVVHQAGTALQNAGGALKKDAGGGNK